MSIEFRPEVKELYESEKKRLAEVRETMFKRYGQSKLLTNDEEVKRQEQFSRELCERIAELGFAADVLWTWQSEEKDEDGFPVAQSPCVSDYEDDNNLYWIPKVVITGRTAKLLEYDHDRQKFEVREGVFDGVKGVIDPNTGELREDGKKKDIY